MHRLNTLSPNGMNSKVLYQIPTNILLYESERRDSYDLHGRRVVTGRPMHPRILVGVFTGRIKKLWVLSYPYIVRLSLLIYNPNHMCKML